MIISAPRLFLGETFTGPGAVEIAGGQIVAVHPGRRDGDVVCADGFLSPGLIDLHNNGAFGVDCAEATPGEWDQYIEGLAQHGVTGVLPTIITAPLKDLYTAAARVAQAAQRHEEIIGLHLEGPFLSHTKRGAHSVDWLKAPESSVIDALLADPAMAKILALVTLAPELPGAMAAIERFVAAGIIVSLGHTEADAAQMSEAARRGARLVTHLFNAQSGLHHRAPGAVGTGLTDELLSPCVIADGVHADPVLLKLAFAACPRAIAVTDSIIIAGLAQGAKAEFGGAPVTMSSDGAGRRHDGRLAGAGITLDEGVRRLIAAGVPEEIAFASATFRPARALGLNERGRIAVDARADIIWWSDDFQVQQVWRAGIPGRPAKAPALDQLTTPEIVTAFLRQESQVPRAMAEMASDLCALIDAITEKMQAGGRLFYAGAGTSGRLGVLDAVELGPTFGIPDNLVIPIIAGGMNAFVRAAEGAEDDKAEALTALQAHGFNAKDAVIGIAASGATPFTLAAVDYANQIGALSGAIVNTPKAPIAKAARFPVVIKTGPEVITGSTRLSAGTAQKIALNILSSTVMMRLGHVHGNLMVDMRASNAKLRARAVTMVRAITGADEARAQMALDKAKGNTKTAALMLLRQLTAEEAKHRLATKKHSLRAALDVQD